MEKPKSILRKSKARSTPKRLHRTSRELLRALAERAGGQLQLALELGVSQASVSIWIRRGWLPPARAMQVERMYDLPRQHLISPRLRNALGPVAFLPVGGAK